MMATRRSFGSLPNFSLELLAMKSIVIRPNWSPLACGRNMYLKFLSASTAEEMQVGIHMNFLSCSRWADRLVEGNVGLALGVAINRLDLVTLDPGLGILVEHDLGAGILQL